MGIVALTPRNRKDANHANQPFEIIGLLKPRFSAVRWAKERELSGLALETQDNNLLACRFYIKHGFQIGGVNTLFYKKCPEPFCQETAIFWYLLF